MSAAAVRASRAGRPAPATDWERLEKATADVDPPFGLVDAAAFDANAADLVHRAAGRPIRVASKSVRSRPLLRRALATPGFAGVLAYTLAEALWLTADGPGAGPEGSGDPDDPDDPGGHGGHGGRGFPDVVVGYPTVDRSALRALATDPIAAARITLMVDTVDHLEFIDAVLGPSARPELRVCLDLDASLRLAGGRVHVGARRSPVHTPAEAAALAGAVADRPGFRLVGVMAYEAQIAGVGDDPPGLRGPAVRGLQAASAAELRRRRAAAVAAVRAVADLEFVNGGGTGSLERTASEPSVTEVAAGSGLYGPTLFDAYRSFTPRAAVLFALPVVRRPGPGLVTVAGGGWIASGPPGPDRMPVPVHPPGLRLTSMEGAGEVQTPLRGAAADDLGIGDRVWFRHAKAGELCEHLDRLLVVEPDGSVTAAPTYRGEGQAF